MSWQARQIRAMIAYSAVTYPELAARTRISDSTLRRIASEKWPREASVDEVLAIAAALGVSEDLLLSEWAQAIPERPAPQTFPLGEGSVEDRLTTLERATVWLVERSDPALR